MSEAQGPDPVNPDVDLLTDVAAVARALLAPGTLDDILARIVTLSRSVLDSCDEAGTCALVVGPTSVSSGSPLASLAEELDSLQTALGEGPCVDAQRGEAVVYASDLRTDPRWPQFAAVAAEAGLRSVIAYQLVAGAETLGSLHLYSHAPAAFDATARAQGLVFAAHAALALDLAQRHRDEQIVLQNLQAALVSREVIGQAQGILMERERLTAAQAFDLLRRCSQDLNIKLRTIAQDVVDTGAVPQPPAPKRTAG